MNLEKQLRQAASEARHATARRRGASIEAVAGGARSLRVVVFVAAAAVVLVAVGASTLVLTKPPGEVLVPVGTNPIDERPGTTVASEPPTTAPGVTTSRAPILDGDGLSGADLLSSRWIAATAENGMILLMEDGIGLGVARGIKPGSGYQLIAPSTRDHDVLIQLGPDDGNLPSVAVGFAAGNGDPIVKVFGIVPAHTVAVELDFGGGELIVINRIFDRPEVERSVFIGAVPESSLVAAEPGSMVLSATDSAGLVTSLAFAGDNVRATAIVRDSYTGALTLRTFQPEPLLIVDSVAVSAIPDLVGCLTFDGVIPPS
ncbi:MAG: hypothetical protein GY720_20860, partial [bacterium]|nr:hypothetical protein [bacterium]